HLVQRQSWEATVMYRPLGLASGSTSNKSLFAGSGHPFRFLANPLSSNARHEGRDDLHDQIGSNSPTPSGVATPRPDLHDKRLPGIMHSYFGQVGRDPSQNTPSRSCQAATNSEASEQSAHSILKVVQEGGKSRTSSASSGSMVMVERAADPMPTPPPDES